MFRLITRWGDMGFPYFTVSFPPFIPYPMAARSAKDAGCQAPACKILVMHVEIFLTGRSAARNSDLIPSASYSCFVGNVYFQTCVLLAYRNSS